MVFRDLTPRANKADINPWILRASSRSAVAVDGLISRGPNGAAAKTAR